MAGVSRSLLAISWAMPPALFPRSLQVSRSLKALAQLDWRTTVVCAEPPRDVTVDSELQRRYEPYYETIRLHQADIANRPASLWRRIFSRAPAEPEAGWVEAASAAGLRAAASRVYDAMVTFAQPWSDHLIGLRIAKRTTLPWLAHFSDPWADSPYLTDDEQRQRAIRDERSIVEAANVLVFPVARLAAEVMRKYPSALSDKVKIVPHGFEAERIGPVHVPRAGHPLRLVHAGDFYGIRTPSALIEALRRMHTRQSLAGRLEVVFVGIMADSHRAEAAAGGLDGVVQFLGRLPHTQCNAVLRTADALLVVDAAAAASIFLPSKLIDYLAFERPIIGLTPNEGASADLLRELGCPVVAPVDVDAIAGILDVLIEQWQDGRVAISDQFRAVAARYDIACTTRKLNGAIETALRCRGPT